MLPRIGSVGPSDGSTGAGAVFLDAGQPANVARKLLFDIKAGEVEREQQRERDKERDRTELISLNRDKVRDGDSDDGSNSDGDGDGDGDDFAARSDEDDDDDEGGLDMEQSMGSSKAILSPRSYLANLSAENRKAAEEDGSIDSYPHSTSDGRSRAGADVGTSRAKAGTRTGAGTAVGTRTEAGMFVNSTSSGSPSSISSGTANSPRFLSIPPQFANMGTTGAASMGAMPATSSPTTPTPKVSRDQYEKPLPLLHFKNEVAAVTAALSITGEPVRTVPNYIPHGMDNNSPNVGFLASMYAEAPVGGAKSSDIPSSPLKPFISNQIEDKDYLHSPQHSRRLCKYFSDIAAKELSIRSSMISPAGDRTINYANGLADSLAADKDNETGDDANSNSNGNSNNCKVPNLIDYSMYDIRGKKNNSHRRVGLRSSLSHNTDSKDAADETEVPGEGQASADASIPPSSLCTCSTGVLVADIRGSSSSGGEGGRRGSYTSSSAVETANNTCCAVCVRSKSLAFDANFESGNLLKAVRTEGRQRLMPSRVGSKTNSSGKEAKGSSSSKNSNAAAGGTSTCSNATDLKQPMPTPIPTSLNDTGTCQSHSCTSGQPAVEVDQEYTMWCRKDLSTNGNIQWYHFAVMTPPDAALLDACNQGSGHTDKETTRRNSNSTSNINSMCIQYPLTVRFNLVNMMKKDALYNYGMRPAVMSILEGLPTEEAQQFAVRAVGGDLNAGPPTPGSPSASEEHQSRTSLAKWRHVGHDVCYYRNGLTAETVDSLGVGTNQSLAEQLEASAAEASGNKKKKKKPNHFYTLTFTYIFERPGDTVYFAHCFPYTYSDLQKYIYNIEKSDKYHSILQRRLLCSTLAGNRCDMLTITARPPKGGYGALSSKSSNTNLSEMASGVGNDNSGGNSYGKEMDSQGDRDSGDEYEDVSFNPVLDSANKPVVVITARVHPGESNSSFAMHGVMEFLLSDHPDAVALRNTFVFKLVPMMNPDGVIHGNYRCSLAATDLNRRYSNCSSILHPSVYAVRTMLQRMQESRHVYLYLDLHGHSKNKNVFMYGCDVVQQPENWLRADLEDRGGSRMSRIDVLAQRVFVRTYPKILCTMSNSRVTTQARTAAAMAMATGVSSATGSSQRNNTSSSHGNANGNANSNDKDKEQGVGPGLLALELPGYFSYADTKFTVTKGKRGTGRVVAWKDVGIENAYTVELSFCGLGDNLERKILTKAEDRGFDIIHCKEKELIAAQKKKDDIARKRRTAAVASKSAKAVAAAAAAVLASSEAQAIGLGTRSAAPISVSAPLTSISLIKNASSNVLSESSQAAVTSAAFEAYEKSLSSQTAGGNNFSTGGGGGSNSINSGAPSANLQNPTVMSDYLAYKKLVNDYSAAVHFTKEDMLNVGRDVCLALSEMANLPQAYNYVSALSSMESQSAYNNKNTSLTASTAAGNKIRAQEGAGEADTSANEGKYPLSENKDKDKSVNDNVSSPPSENLSNMTSDQWALSRRILERPLPPAKAPTTPFYDHSEMHNPLIHISSFSTDACHYAQRRFATEFDNMGVGWGRVGRTYGSVTNGVAPADVGLPVNKIGANVGLRMKVEIDITKEFGYVLENPNQDRGGRTRRSIFAGNSSNDNNGSGVEEQGGDDREDSASPFSTDLNADTVSAASSSVVDGEKTSKTKPRREAQSKKNRGKSKNSSNSSSDNGIASAESARLFDFTDFFSGPSKTTAAADAESEGSDSDPSVDNVPTETMLRKLGKAKVEAGSGPATDVSNILRAAEIKKRRADAKIAKSNNVLEKRRLANLQKAQFIQYQLEKQRYDEAKASHTFSNPTLSAGNSSGNMSGGGSHGNGSKSGHDDSTNPKFSARSRKGSVAGGSGGGSGVSSKEKIVPKGSRLVSHQKKKYISHTPSYKLATDYNDDDASMTPVGEVGNLSLSTHVGSGSYYKDGLNSFVGGAGAGVCRTPVAVQQYPNPLAQSSSASASEFYSGSGYGYAPSSSSTSSQSRAQETNSPLRRWNSLASLDSNNAANNSSASYSNSRCSYSDGHGNGNGDGNGRPTSAESETFSVPDGNETLSAFSSFIKANEGKGRTERHNQNQKQGLDVRLRERGKGRDRGFAGGDSVQGGVEGGGRHVYGEANYSPAERRLQVDLDAAVAAMATAMTTTTSTATSDDGGITLYNEDLMGLGGGTGVGMGMSGADPSSFFVAAAAAAGSPSSSLVTEAAQAGNIGDAIRDRAGVRERERRFQMHLLQQRLKSMNDAAAAEKTTTLQGQGDGSNGTDVKRSRGMIRGVSSRSPNELKAVLPLVPISSPARGGGGEESRRSHTHTTRVRSISSSSIDQDFYVAPSFSSSPSAGTGTGTGTEAGRISPSQKLIKKVPTSGAAAVAMARPVAARHMASDFDAAGTWKGNSDSSSF